MPFRHSCPNCRTVLEIRAANPEGRQVRCPKCAEQSTIGARQTAVAQRAQRPRAAAHGRSAAPRRRPRDRDDYEEAQPERMTSRMFGILITAIFVLVGGVALAIVLVVSSGKDEDKGKIAKKGNEEPIVRDRQRRPDPFVPPTGGAGLPDQLPNGTGAKPNDPPLNPNLPGGGIPMGGGDPPVQPRPQPPIQPRPRPPRNDPPPPEITIPTQPISIPTGDGKPLFVLDAEGHVDVVKGTLFTPDGKQIITVSADKAIRFWDLNTGRIDRVIRLPIGPGNEGAIFTAALTRDGKLLAVGGWPFGDGKLGILIHLVNVESGQVEHVFDKGLKAGLVSLDFSPDGTRLAAGAANGALMIYNVAEHKPMGVLPNGHQDRVQQVAFHPSGRYLASASADKTVRLWDLQARNPLLKVVEGFPRKVNCVAWSPDGMQFVTGGVDGMIRLWNRDGRPVKDLFAKNVARTSDGKTIPTQITSLHYLPDGRELVYTGIAWTGEAGVVNARTGEERLAMRKHNNTVQTAGVSRDGKLVVSSGGNDNEVLVWKVDDGSIVHTLQGKGQGVMAVGWHPDGKQIAWGNTNRMFGQIGLARLERSFDLESLTLAPYKQNVKYQDAVHQQGELSLARVDLFTIAFRRNGRTYLNYKFKDATERIYSVSFFGKDKVIIGGAYRLLLVDLNGRTLKQFVGHTGIHFAVAPRPDGKYFLSGSTDQTICVWSPDHGRPLMRIFFADRSWIVWTPEGFYAASPYGERLMGWQINNGKDQVATFYPAVQFRRSLYQPKLIQILLKVGNVQQALVQAGVNQGNAVRVEQVLPPLVAVTSPAKNGLVRINQGKFQVKAVAQSQGNHPVLAMRLLVDGRPYLGNRGVVHVANPKPGQVGATWNVDLPPGKHSLAVQAASRVSKGTSSKVEVALGGQPTQPSLYVLAYGVSEYPDEMKLNFAASDAILLTSVLRQRAGNVFKNVEVKLVTDRSATKQGIINGLSWLEERMTWHDVGIIFFSGHGARLENGEFFLVPVDARVEDVKGSCVSGDKFKGALENLPGRIVLMLDCCHSGSVTEKSKPPRLADDLVRDLVTDDYGIIVMCSSLGSEYSLESRDVQAGFFTRGLERGLNGEADFNRDRVIFIHELNLYTALFVKTISRGLQNPVTGFPPNVKTFPLARR